MSGIVDIGSNAAHASFTEPHVPISRGKYNHSILFPGLRLGSILCLCMADLIHYANRALVRFNFIISLSAEEEENGFLDRRHRRQAVRDQDYTLGKYDFPRKTLHEHGSIQTKYGAMMNVYP